MKIKSVKIENFRSFRDETISFDDYTCLVGPNGSGKSTVLNALNIFFRQSKDTQTDLSKLSIEDFHHKNTSTPVKITVTFTDLSEQAKNDLSDYVRQDTLIVSATAEFDPDTQSAEVKQYGNRLGFEVFRRYFEADKSGAKAPELKEIYAQLKTQFTDLPNETTKTGMADALRAYESTKPDDCILIESEDQFYGVSKGANRLAPHIQWIFVPASKDVSNEREESTTSALGQLLARTVRSKVSFKEKIDELKSKFKDEYGTVLEGEQTALDDISESLKSRLETWSHPGISTKVLWNQDPEKSVKVEEPSAYIQIGERGFEGDLMRFGHGLQRSYMLALLQELTNLPSDSSPTLVMAIEEPEIYQHPPQVRYLAETLHDLTEGESQVIVCSHHPLFIPGDNFEAIRIVREKDEPSASYVSSLKYADIARLLEGTDENVVKETGMLAKLYPSLNPVVNEMFFCNILILTEGIEDIAYLTTYLMLTDQLNEFRKNGCHIVSTNGKDKLIKPVAMAKLLNIPVFVVCDADTDKTNDSEIVQHKKENKKIQELLGHTPENEWPDENIFDTNLVMWKHNLTDAIKEELDTNWAKYKQQAEDHYGNPGGLNKNPLAIAKALNLAWDENVKSELLKNVTTAIIEFAKQSRRGS